MVYSASSYSSLPSKTGVYRFLDDRGNVLYVGKAIDLKSRVSSYFVSPQLLGEKTRVLVSQIKKIQITIVETELEALLLEAFYIKKYKPKYNIIQKDNKSYLKVRITINNPYPAVLFTRKEDDSKSLYFGPYPSSGALRSVLKIIRRAFPYHSVLNHPKRICLYNHLGLCPCWPSKNSYRRNIRAVIKILEGKSKKIMQELKKERDILSKNENYEEALTIQKKIDTLSFITSPFHRPFEYDVNPNLREDIRMKEMQELIQILNAQGYSLKSLHRIECYDISNTQGTNPTASMVVLTNGEIDKSQYRKFKMRGKGPNDFAMMQEVLTRRLKHHEWEEPNLIVVDGGRGQVSSALKVLEEMNKDIPLIGLAKREETIIVPVIPAKVGIQLNQNIKTKVLFKEVSLPKNAKALHLIMRIRDEAHRFAITYHKLLRGKNVFKATS